MNICSTFLIFLLLEVVIMSKLIQLSVQRVIQIPKDMEEGVLYVSYEFETAAHLCACGCGSKVRTPLGPTGWTLYEHKEGPTLVPSIGNWQLPCRSHYFVTNGKIRWAGEWTTEQVMLGRKYEFDRKVDYYNSMYGNDGFLSKLWKIIKDIFSK